MNPIESCNRETSSSSVSSFMRRYRKWFAIGAEALAFVGLVGTEAACSGQGEQQQQPRDGRSAAPRIIYSPSVTYMIAPGPQNSSQKVSFKDTAKKVTGEWFVVVTDCFETGRVDIDITNRHPYQTDGIKNRVFSEKRGSTLMSITNAEGAWVEGVDEKFEALLGKFHVDTTSVINGTKSLIGRMVDDSLAIGTGLGFYEIGVLGTKEHPVGWKDPQPFYDLEELKEVPPQGVRVADAPLPGLRDALSAVGLHLPSTLGLRGDLAPTMADKALVI